MKITPNNLRASILGVNDGVVSNYCLVLTLYAASVSDSRILLSGLGGLFAGACSMALGEWLSVYEASKETALLHESPQNPYSAAALSYGFFSIVAFISLIPFLLGQSNPILYSSLYIILFLITTGYVTAKIDKGNPTASIIRQILVTGIAALVTFGVGIFLGKFV